MHKITGRLGNQMFQFAFLYDWTRKHDVDRYVQDPKYFQHYTDEILYIFREGVPRQTDMVAIHVRRGDYVNHNFYINLSETTYYEDAMDLFPDADFLVFSDDIEFCKEKFKDYDNVSYSEGNTEIGDMNLMASCVGHIIANSSFSWWGAFISPYTRKVVAPKEWHPDGVERTVCPPEWIRI